MRRITKACYSLCGAARNATLLRKVDDFGHETYWTTTESGPVTYAVHYPNGPDIELKNNND